MAAAFLGLVLIALSAWTAVSSYEEARDEEEQTLQRVAHTERLDLIGYLDRARALTAQMARNGVFAEHALDHDDGEGERAVANALTGLQDLTHGFGEACLTDETGAVHACAVGDDVTPEEELWPDYSWTTFFEPALELDPGEVHQTRPYVSNTNHTVVANATPIDRPDGTGDAIIHVETPIDAFRREALDGADGFEVAVVERADADVTTDDTVVFDTVETTVSGGSAAGGYTPAGALPEAGTSYVVDGRLAVLEHVDSGPDNTNDWLVIARSPDPAPSFLGSLGTTQIALFAAGLVLLMAGAVLVRHSRRAAVETARMKGDLLGLVSHELRTPLTSIIGYTELLAELEAERLSDQGRKFLDVIDRNAKRELRLVGDLLTLQQIDRGGFSINAETQALAPVVEDALAAARPKAEEKGIELRAELDASVEAPTDAVRLGQVLDNLLSNAIKYTPEGGEVRVGLSIEGATAILEVEDTGLGIPPGEVDRLFERMFRASNATELHIPGIGLGLSIVKALVEAHGGRVSVRSAVAEGTTFRVELPAAERPRAGGGSGPEVAIPA